LILFSTSRILKKTNQKQIPSDVIRNEKPRWQHVNNFWGAVNEELKYMHRNKTELIHVNRVSHYLVRCIAFLMINILVGKRSNLLLDLKLSFRALPQHFTVYADACEIIFTITDFNKASLEIQKEIKATPRVNGGVPISLHILDYVKENIIFFCKHVAIGLSKLSVKVNRAHKDIYTCIKYEILFSLFIATTTLHFAAVAVLMGMYWLTAHHGSLLDTIHVHNDIAASHVDPLHLKYFTFARRMIGLALMHKVNITLKDISVADTVKYASAHELGTVKEDKISVILDGFNEYEIVIIIIIFDYLEVCYMFTGIFEIQILKWHYLSLLPEQLNIK
ncbi:hypothetical protein ACJX0J_013775, partial [Zea mays]